MTSHLTLTVRSTTTTLLCPSPSPNLKLTCELPANGYRENMLDTYYDISAEQCQQQCLQNPLCLSYQTIPQDILVRQYLNCNLYKTVVSGNVDTWDDKNPARFYDRDCQTLTPNGCRAPRIKNRDPVPLPVITAAPKLKNREVKAVQRRQNQSIPTWLAVLGYENLWFGCSCIVTQAAPATTTTTTESLHRYSFTSVSRYPGG